MSQSPATDSLISHYRIVSKLGAGGMGEVWLAEDTRLGRKVALKLLPAEFTADSERVRRFTQEAKAASALNHPNIIAVHDIGDSETGRFIVMEFVAGRTLRSVIAKDNSLETFFTLGAQMARALSAAHAAGITHRDIKPDNIMVRDDGYVKMLDFGLARLLPTTASDPEAMTLAQQTTPGTVMGTLAYMSPEQASGQTAGAASDVFSLGIVLYELATGRHPFKSETMIGYLHAITSQVPPSMTSLKSHLPPALDDLILRMLEKDARQRPTAGEVAQALQEIEKYGSNNTLPFRVAADKPKAPTAETDTRGSIAVLPFTNISADEENEYFCDGLAEELLNALSKIDDLKVAARTSAFSFKGKNVNVSEIGERLGVRNVLEGSVRKSGNRLRISVQLVNASDGFHLWSERYDREMQDIFELQDEITLAVTDALKVRLFGRDRDVVLRRYTDNAEAYELFLKGRYYYYKYSAEGWRRAIEFFAKAIEIEPNYAPAYAGMNSSWGFLWFLGFLPAAQAVTQMKAAAIKALEIDENLAEAHLSQAMISFFYDWEWQKAEQEFKRAITLDPHNAEALSFYSMFLGFEERFDEAIDQGGRALASDPLSTLINMNVGWTYFSAGLFDKTLDQVSKMIEIEPDFYGSYWLSGAIYLSKGEYDNAVNELKKAVSLGGRQIVLADLGGAYGLAGKNDEATAILDQLLEMRQRDYVPAICMARIYSRIGENDKAIDWLEKAFEEKNGEMVFLKGEIDGAAQGDSLNSLGKDPRVKDLLERMKLPSRDQGE
jgi:serine/threonine protein kinase/Tfp pilus assembly protein PilF